MVKKTEGRMRGVRSVTLSGRSPGPGPLRLSAADKNVCPTHAVRLERWAGIPACPARSAGLAERRTQLKAALSC